MTFPSPPPPPSLILVFIGLFPKFIFFTHLSLLRMNLPFPKYIFPRRHHLGWGLSHALQWVGWSWLEPAVSGSGAAPASPLLTGLPCSPPPAPYPKPDAESSATETYLVCAPGLLGTRWRTGASQHSSIWQQQALVSQHLPLDYGHVLLFGCFCSARYR